MACAALLLLPLLSCGSRRKQPADAPAAGGYEIRLTDALLHDGASDTLRLGSLRSGEMAAYRIRLVNASSEPLVVTTHELTCGCIALDYKKRPFAPGDGLPVELRFDTRGLYGWQLKSCRLRFQEGVRPLTLCVETVVE